MLSIVPKEQMRSIKVSIKTIIGLYLVVNCMLYFFQEKLLFLPAKLPADYEFSFKYPFEEFNLTAPDGAVLNALHFKLEEPKGLVLYFHGNAGDLSRWGTVTTFFVEQGYDVIVMDYRTYGKSTGKLSEGALHLDAQLFYEHALKRYEENKIVLYGRSLGTGVASRLASKNNPGQLLLESPYYSLESVAKTRFPFLPVKWLLKYRLPSYEFVQAVKCPITIFHGTEDSVVPYTSGSELFDAIPNSEKKMYTIKGGEHNNLVEFQAYQRGISETLN